MDVTTGPHPAVAEVRRAVRVGLPDRPVLVACSGGADSLALAAAVAFEAPRHGITAGLITVDHGLQPGSAAQAEAVTVLGHRLGLDPVQVIRVDVGTGGGPEAAARAARYGALAAAAQATGSDVLLGHTLDDQAETVLLGLGRGSGPRSVAGMRPVDGRYLRPLLGVRRATTLAACAAQGLTPWDDPHNADPAFARVRLRHEVLPLLEDVLNGGVAEALARTATLLRTDLDALDALATETFAALLDPFSPSSPVINSRSPATSHRSARVDHLSVEGARDSARAGASADAGDGVEVAALAALTPAIRTRVLRLWVAAAGGGPLTATHLGALDALIVDWHGQGAVDLPGGCAARRASGRLTLRRGATGNVATASTAQE